MLAFLSGVNFSPARLYPATCFPISKYSWCFWTQIAISIKILRIRAAVLVLIVLVDPDAGSAVVPIQGFHLTLLGCLKRFRLGFFEWYIHWFSLCGTASASDINALKFFISITISCIVSFRSTGFSRDIT